MPELPEVETIKRDLEKELVGALLEEVKVFQKDFIKRLGLEFENFEKLKEKSLKSLWRKGKYLIFNFGSHVLIFHLGLTGILIFSFEEDPLGQGKHKLLALKFSSGFLIFYDIRKLGKIFIVSREELPKVLNIGYDALEISLEDFKRLFQTFRGSKVSLKAFLLDQKYLAGLGNIYIDELLFRAKISPLRPVSDLKEEELERLYFSLKELLELAIALRGSSIRNYLDGRGERGSFQERHLVYGKAGSPCPLCGNSLQKIKINQRTTVYCINCQK